MECVNFSHMSQVSLGQKSAKSLAILCEKCLYSSFVTLTQQTRGTQLADCLKHGLVKYGQIP